ncbi:DUF418 domain-containing protein [Sphingomonas sp. LB-2]|uniref:DUF418 domain-containing protein n=1 Tax=Sphingomonas caeni TaxID=2984949 RepID=UPI002231C15A|nr:DUF418 domain-containing protein [Sphingomonas caeni]MCW3845752.1 DUF418 domain-containing protein [Sphingomonas caeni]
MSEAPARLQTLDTVRGVAVMGILLLNIVAFGLPEAAYFNPRAYGGAEGWDLAAYLANFVLFDGKMRGLFSFLFGASMLLVIEGAEAKGESPASVHYRRMGWLLVFGLAHLWLVWFGDILGGYALIGMVAFLLRKLPVRRMVILGAMLVVVQTVLFTLLPLGVHYLQSIPEGAPGYADAVKQIDDFNRNFGIPSAAENARQLALFRGGYAGIVADRFAHNQLGPLPMALLYGSETIAYMLFGMAALRSGMLRGEWPRARLRRFAWIGFGIGVPAYAAIAAWLINRDFALLPVMTAVFVLTTPVRPILFLGWAALILLLARPGGLLTERIAAAGRMAFTNYLTTSLICTTLFYGYGLGWFGTLSRAELYLVVLAVWALILLWSKPWLARFRYGPFEWAWRSLARGEPQPMKGAAASG